MRLLTLSDESLTIREPDLMWAHVPCGTAHVAVGFRSVTKVSNLDRTSDDDRECHSLSVAAPHGSAVFVSRKPRVIEINCYQVRRELSDYLEGDLTPQLRLQIEEHFRSCNHCRAVFDDMRNILLLLSD